MYFGPEFGVEFDGDLRFAQKIRHSFATRPLEKERKKERKKKEEEERKPESMPF